MSVLYECVVCVCCMSVLYVCVVCVCVRICGLRNCAYWVRIVGI